MKAANKETTKKDWANEIINLKENLNKSNGHLERDKTLKKKRRGKTERE